MGHVVLVTGVSRQIGGQFAHQLSQHPHIDRVIGVDITAPTTNLGDVEFIRADIRNPVIGKVLKYSQADTVVHLNVVATPLTVGGRAVMKEINVIGSMQLFAACAKSPHLQRIVVKSSAGVYGASPADSALFREDRDATELPRSGWAKDSCEVESYTNSFARRNTGVTVTMLRFANILGPRLHTAMSDYLELPVWPTTLGHDPRLQFVHLQDALDALQTAAFSDVTGPINIAGDGIITLHQAASLAGRPTVALPASFVRAGAKSLRKGGVLDFSPEQFNLLTYGRVLDTTRMTTELGFTPQHDTKATFCDFSQHRLGDQEHHEAAHKTHHFLRTLVNTAQARSQRP